DPGQTFGAVDTYKFCVIVNGTTGKRSATWHTQGNHAACRIVGRTGEDFEIYIFHQVRDISEFQVVTQVRLVGTKTTHCLTPGHARELAQIHIQVLLENGANHALHNGHDVFLIQE